VVAIVLGVEVRCYGDDLAIVASAGLQSKKLNKFMTILSNDRLVQVWVHFSVSHRPFIPMDPTYLMELDNKGYT
jgi:hypothetical protein